MPRLVHRLPKYRRHKASGQAVVTINKRDIYLGDWKSPESRSEYKRIIREWQANHVTPTKPEPRVVRIPGITVVELVAQFLDYADAFYVRPDGTPTGESQNFRDAVKPWVEMYGRDAVADLGPLALRAVRQAMIERGWSRNTINRQVERVRQVVRWGVGRELVSVLVPQALDQVEPLAAGKSKARETKPIRCVDPQLVEATLPYLQDVLGPLLEVTLGE